MMSWSAQTHICSCLLLTLFEICKFLTLENVKAKNYKHQIKVTLLFYYDDQDIFMEYGKIKHLPA